MLRILCKELFSCYAIKCLLSNKKNSIETWSLLREHAKVGALYMSRVMRKPADQLRVNSLSIVQSLDLLTPNFKPLAIFFGCTAWFVSDVVGNIENRFSHDAVHFI